MPERPEFKQPEAPEAAPEVSKEAQKEAEVKPLPEREKPSAEQIFDQLKKEIERAKDLREELRSKKEDKTVESSELAKLDQELAKVEEKMAQLRQQLDETAGLTAKDRKTISDLKKQIKAGEGMGMPVGEPVAKPEPEMPTTEKPGLWGKIKGWFTKGAEDKMAKKAEMTEEEAELAEMKAGAAQAKAEKKGEKMLQKAEEEERKREAAEALQRPALGPEELEAEMTGEAEVVREEDIVERLDEEDEDKKAA